MVNNSTLLFIIDEPNSECEIINISELLDLKDKCKTELEIIFGALNYLPSDEAINRILNHA
jgi:hypothetical protein